jgi:hypothetical protein
LEYGDVTEDISSVHIHVGVVVSARRFRFPLGAGGRSADMTSIPERQHSIPAALIAAVTDRLDVVGRIALNADAWDTRPQRITTVGQQVVGLGCPNLGAGLSATGTPVRPRSVPPPVGRSRRAEREQASRWETDGGRVRELT